MLSKQTLKILKCAVRFRNKVRCYIYHTTQNVLAYFFQALWDELKNTSRIVSTTARLRRYLPSYVMKYTDVKENLTKELR